MISPHTPRKIFSTVQLVAGLLVAVVLSGCSSSTAPATPVPIGMKVGAAVWPGNSLLYIADAKGLFAKQNLTVTLKIYSVNDESNADFAAKRLDGDAFVFSDALSQVANGIPAKVAWVIDSSVGGDQIVGKSAVTSLKDLKGKKVGVSYGTFGQVFLVSLLSKVGLTINDFTCISVSGVTVTRPCRRS